MHHSPDASTIAMWIVVILIVLVIFGVLRALVRPLVAVALIAIVLILLGIWRADAVAHFARVAVHAVYEFVASLFGAAHA
jgi:hypothetical protein